MSHQKVASCRRFKSIHRRKVKIKNKLTKNKSSSRLIAGRKSKTQKYKKDDGENRHKIKHQRMVGRKLFGTPKGGTRKHVGLLLQDFLVYFMQVR
jgi:hypothetical protein